MMCCPRLAFYLPYYIVQRNETSFWSSNAMLYFRKPMSYENKVPLYNSRVPLYENKVPLYVQIF